MLSALLALCEGTPPVTGGFHTQRANDAQVWYILCCEPERPVEQIVQLSVIWDDMTLLRRNRDEVSLFLPSGEITNIMFHN